MKRFITSGFDYGVIVPAAVAAPTQSRWTQESHPEVSCWRLAGGFPVSVLLGILALSTFLYYAGYQRGNITGMENMRQQTDRTFKAYKASLEASLSAETEEDMAVVEVSSAEE